MGGLSFWHWIIVLMVVLIVFGAGKLPRVATDVAQGIKNFRKGMQDPPDQTPPEGDNQPPPGQIHASDNAGKEHKPVADKVSS
jgi:sec-independent protein translocase protein TatA